MTACILDASVAAKWLLPRSTEPLWEEARRLLESFSAGRVRLLVPDLFWLETGNVLWRAVRCGRMSRAAAQQSIAMLQESRIATAPTAPLLDDAFAIAATYNRTVYDSAYVALAVQAGMPLVTADEKLANALASTFPIRWLGAL